jgi:hypothetical protein
MLTGERRRSGSRPARTPVERDVGNPSEAREHESIPSTGGRTQPRIASLRAHVPRAKPIRRIRGCTEGPGPSICPSDPSALPCRRSQGESRSRDRTKGVAEIATGNLRDGGANRGRVPSPRTDMGEEMTESTGRSRGTGRAGLGRSNSSTGDETDDTARTFDRNYGGHVGVLEFHAAKRLVGR